MELKNLKTFVKIAQYKSFSKTAEYLGYAQSTVTTQIKLLEEELETKLFERSGRCVELTAHGELFLEYAEKILLLSEKAKNVLDEKNTPKGTLRIGVVESICTLKLPELLKIYHLKYPEVDIVIKLGFCAELRKMLKNNSVDVAFMLDQEIRQDEFVSSLSINEPMVILAAANHRFRNKISLTMKDIANEPLILTEKGCSYRCALENRFYKNHLQPHIALEVGNIETIKSFVKSNLGITLLPRMTVTEELAKKELVILNVEECDIKMNRQIIYLKNKWITAAMQSFISLAIELENVKK
ncbi:LysR family transcriptional regulator [Anaerosinus massiliensis]|uniref:LysR family transcriptional regulator n=1 Tax=Massilibacillus massiliensis TaxID=1806837 RepID=UPI000A4DD8AB|nr:LysR family transcriptional regulator [Massilibacillus massiliensis]